jgi:hypothetical protein
MFSLAGINWIAVIVGVVLSNALGFLWYGPLVWTSLRKAVDRRPRQAAGRGAAVP